MMPDGEVVPTHVRRLQDKLSGIAILGLIGCVVSLIVWIYLSGASATQHELQEMKASSKQREERITTLEKSTALTQQQISIIQDTIGELRKSQEKNSDKLDAILKEVKR